MSFIAERFTEILGAVIPDPTADRGTLMLFGFVGSVALLANACLFSSFASPLNEPRWGISLLGVTTVGAIAGLVYGSFYLVRKESDHTFAVVCVGINVVALAITFVGVGP